MVEGTTFGFVYEVPLLGLQGFVPLKRNEREREVKRETERDIYICIYID